MNCVVFIPISVICLSYSSGGMTSGSSSVSQSRGTNNAQLLKNINVNTRVKNVKNLRRKEGIDILGSY